jgi:hypothetical protein
MQHLRSPARTEQRLSHSVVAHWIVVSIRFAAPLTAPVAAGRGVPAELSTVRDYPEARLAVVEDFDLDHSTAAQTILAPIVARLLH